MDVSSKDELEKDLNQQSLSGLLGLTYIEKYYCDTNQLQFYGAFLAHRETK